jgi:hypothetical protein
LAQLGRGSTDVECSAFLSLLQFLDSIVWEPDKTAMQRSRDSIVPSLRSFIDSQRAGVIEGCCGELVRAASAHCTLLVFLNPGMDAYLANNLKRPWEPHKYASLDLQTRCLVSFKSGWRLIINEKMRGHTGSIVKSSTPSQVAKWSIVRSMRILPNNRLPEH